MTSKRTPHPDGCDCRRCQGAPPDSEQRRLADRMRVAEMFAPIGAPPPPYRDKLSPAEQIMQEHFAKQAAVQATRARGKPRTSKKQLAKLAGAKAAGEAIPATLGSPADLRASRDDYIALHGTDRGWLTVAVLTFQLSEKTIRSRIKETK